MNYKRSDNQQQQISITNQVNYKLTPFTTAYLMDTTTSSTATTTSTHFNTSSSSTSETNIPIILTLTDLEKESDINGWKQQVVCSLKFICTSTKEGFSWCQSVQNNVAILTQKVFECKLKKYQILSANSISPNKTPPKKQAEDVEEEEEEEEEEDELGPLDSSRSHYSTSSSATTEELHTSPNHPQHQHNTSNELKPMQNNLLETITKSKTGIYCCGYMIRKNYQHQVLYQKPSILFVVLNQAAEIVFHKTHTMNNIADVIACKVNFSKQQDIIVQNIEGSILAFALCMNQTPIEIFAASDLTQKNLWMKSINKVIHLIRDSKLPHLSSPQPIQSSSTTTTTTVTEDEENTSTYSQTVSEFSDDEATDHSEKLLKKHLTPKQQQQQQQQMIQPATQSPIKEEEDYITNETGTMRIKGEIEEEDDTYGDGSSTFIVHETKKSKKKIPNFMQDENDDGTGTFVVHGEKEEEGDDSEPDFFGIKNKNVFTGNFWKPPQESTTISGSSSTTPTNQMSTRRKFPAELVIRELRSQLEEKDQEINELKEQVEHLLLMNQELEKQLLFYQKS